MFMGVLIGYKAVSDVLGRLCAFAVVLLAVRQLPTDQFGLFSLAWAAGWIVAIASDFGLQLHLTREVARRPGEAGSVFGRLLRMRLALSAVALLGAAVVPPIFGWSAYWLPFMLVIASQIFGSLVEFHYYLFRGLSRSELESTLSLASRLLTLILAAAFLWYSRSLLALAIALAVGNGLALAAAHWLSSQLVRSGSRATEGATGLVGDVLPIGIGIFLSALYFRVDLFFLDHWIGQDAVALYSAVFRLIDAVRLLPAAVLAVIFPEFCRPGGRRAFVRPAVGLFCLAVVMAGALSWQADVVVRVLFGDAYLASIPMLRLLLFSLPPLFVNLVLTHQLIAADRQGTYAAVCGLGLVLSLGLNGLLVPSFGPDGAAMACGIREWVLTAACLAGLRFRARLPFSRPAVRRRGSGA